MAVPFALGSDDDAKPVVKAVQEADRNPDFDVTVSGLHTINDDFNTLSETDLRSGELRYGLPAALIILVLVFGAVVAGLVPVAMAIVSILVGMGLVAVLSQAFDLSVFIVNMLVGMGLALGIDYSLFVISRYREERGRGLEQEHAIAAAGATASRAVLFSGSAFVIALFGMLLVPTTIMRSLAAGAIIVGIVSVRGRADAAAGAARRARRRRERAARADRRALVPRAQEPRGPVLAGHRRPRAAAARDLARGLGDGAARDRAPVFGLKIGASGVARCRTASRRSRATSCSSGSSRTSTRARRASWLPGGATGRCGKSSTRLRARLAADPRFGPGRAAALAGRGRRAASTSRSAATRRQAARSPRSATCAHSILPQAFAGTDAKPLVGGTDGGERRLLRRGRRTRRRCVFAFVLGLSLVLLTIAFRSVVVALTAIVLNLLSVGAAYGLLVLVFQHGVGTGLLGFQQVDVIEAWVPLFLFSVLFGLSMDYQVFLLSRIRSATTSSATPPRPSRRASRRRRASSRARR